MLNTLLHVAGQFALGHSIAEIENHQKFDDNDEILAPQLTLSYVNNIFNYSWQTMTVLGLISMSNWHLYQKLYGEESDFDNYVRNLISFTQVVNLIATAYILCTTGLASIAITLCTYMVCKLGQNGYLSFEPVKTINTMILNDTLFQNFTMLAALPGLNKLIVLFLPKGKCI